MGGAMATVCAYLCLRWAGKTGREEDESKRGAGEGEVAKQ